MVFQDSDIPESLTPHSPGSKTYLLFDGASSGDGLRKWYQLGLDVCPLMVMKDGVYDGVSALGPMIADLNSSEALKELWSQNHPIMGRTAIVHTPLTAAELLGYVRARAQVIMPDGRAVWLRIGDAKVMARLANVDNRLPSQFWSGLDAIFFRSAGESIVRYQPSHSTYSNGNHGQAVLSSSVMPCFQFSMDLLSALDKSNDFEHREVL